MFILWICVVLVALRGFIDEAEGLVELPEVEDNEILNTENLIRSSTNDIFSSLRLKRVKEKPRLKQYALIHKYFISLTLRDHHTLNEVARLTRVGKTVDNKSENFIALINEILNGDHSSELQGKNKSIVEDVDDDFINFLDNQLTGLGYLKLDYVYNNTPADINKSIIDILSRNDEIREFNVTVNQQELFNDDTLIQKSNIFVPGERSGRRIFRGHRTKIKQYPFVAVVQMFNKFQCGGAIISTDMVITAASCVQLAFNNRFYRENPSFLSVRVGSNYYNAGGEVFSVLEVYFHPQYNSETLQNNLAGLRLRVHLKFHKRAMKTEFDRDAVALSSTTNGIMIVGWGAKSRSNIVKGPRENTLSVDQLPFYPLQACQEIYSKDHVTEKNFCAGYSTKGSGACNSDVGNPGVVGAKLVGIVSFGSPVCGAPDFPTVFTELGYYADWIETVLLDRIPIRRVIHKVPKTTVYYMNPWTKPTMAKKKVTKALYNITGGNIQAKRFDLLPRAQKIDPKSNEDFELDREMFKDFLGTMFNSNKEVQDYMGLVDKKNNMQKVSKTCNADENPISENILKSMGEIFKNDSLLSETINSLKRTLEKSSNKKTLRNETDINTYFDLLDIDELSKNKSEELGESEETEVSTKANISKQDSFAKNSLLDVVLDTAKKNILVKNVKDLSFTKISDEILHKTKSRANAKINDYSNPVDNCEEQGLRVISIKDKDLLTSMSLSNQNNADISNSKTSGDQFVKRPQDWEKIMYIDDSDTDISHDSSSEETMMIDLPSTNVNSKFDNDKSLKNFENTNTNKFSQRMNLILKLENLLHKVQNEILVNAD